MDAPNRRTLLRSAGLAALLLANLRAMPAWAQAGDASAEKRMPTLFLAQNQASRALERNALNRRLRALGRALPRPKAILVVSSHWLTSTVTEVTLQDAPALLPSGAETSDALKSVLYAAPGAPDFARLAMQLAPGLVLPSVGWGLDYGAWGSLMHLFPEADIGVFQVSLDMSQPARYHYELGQAFSQLRDQGVLIVATGNLIRGANRLRTVPGNTTQASEEWAAAFDVILVEALSTRNDDGLVDFYGLAAEAQQAVPEPAFYLPLLYALGAAEGDPVTFPFEGWQDGTASMRCVRFG